MYKEKLKMKKKRKNKMKVKNRDQAIVAAYNRQINLNVRVVKSKRDYDRNNHKSETRKLASL